MKIECPRAGEEKFREKFLPEGTPPICCQFVISLKSLLWQHMWGSKSLLTFWPKSRFFDFLTSKSWFSTESSTEALVAIIDAESNIASFLPKNNNFVIFQQNGCSVVSDNIYITRTILTLNINFLFIFGPSFSKNSIIWKIWSKNEQKIYVESKDCPSGINVVRNHWTSILLKNNKIVVFRQQMLFFYQFSDFRMNEND